MRPIGCGLAQREWEFDKKTPVAETHGRSDPRDQIIVRSVGIGDDDLAAARAEDPIRPDQNLKPLDELTLGSIEPFGADSKQHRLGTEDVHNAVGVADLTCQHLHGGS